MRALILVAALGGVAHAEDGRELATITAGLRAGDGGGFALVHSDYDPRGISFGVNVEASLAPHVRAVMRIDGDRPGAGFAYVLAPYATAYLLYTAEGFSEPGGEIESAFALAHGPLVGSLTFGQDADARNRDLEGALAARAEVARGLFTGAMARYRDALGTTGEALARDAFGGVVATIAIDRIAITAMAGAAGVQRTGGRFETGAAATLAIGTAF